jgi:phage terminase large subunit GpA-like protein
MLAPTRIDHPNGDALVRGAYVDGLRPDPREPMSQWADKYRVLNQTYAAEPGRWRTERTPYLREIMDAFSPTARCEFVAVMKGAQLGFTEILTNMLGYIIHRAPGPAMMVQPTQNLAKRFSKQRLATMIDDVPVLRGKVADPRARDSGNTTMAKNFDGGVLFLAGANSAADLRSAPVRYLLLDEVDAYPYDVDDEGDPIELAVNRTKTFARRKVLIGSTPTVKDVSRVEREFLKGDQRFFEVPCPHCATPQSLEWQHVKWDKDADGQHDPETAFYACPHCGGKIEEHHKKPMLAQGQWVARKPENNLGDRRRSYHINSLYSPWESWASLVYKFLDAQRDPHLLKTFINTALGECWDEEANRVDQNDLAKRAEAYPLRTIPKGGLIVTGGIDVQDNRLEVVLWAWGRAEEAWVVDYQVFFGSPAEPTVWTDLERYLAQPLTHEVGTAMVPRAVAIDTGGHHTQQVYDFARRNRHKGVIAVKGMSVANRPVISKPSAQDVTARGKTIRGGVQLWPVGTDTAKQVIYGRFGIEEGPGRMHFSNDLPDEFYAQITAEKMATRYHKGHPRIEWVKPSHRRNEVLDCTVYALAAAYQLGMPRWRDRDWDALEEHAQPRVADLFGATPKPHAQPIPEKKEVPPAVIQNAQTVRRPRRGGFVNAY